MHKRFIPHPGHHMATSRAAPAVPPGRDVAGDPNDAHQEIQVIIRIHAGRTPLPHHRGIRPFPPHHSNQNTHTPKGGLPSPPSSLPLPDPDRCKLIRSKRGSPEPQQVSMPPKENLSAARGSVAPAAAQESRAPMRPLPKLLGGNALLNLGTKSAGDGGAGLTCPRPAARLRAQR